MAGCRRVGGAEIDHGVFPRDGVSRTGGARGATSPGLTNRLPMVRVARNLSGDKGAHEAVNVDDLWRLCPGTTMEVVRNLPGAPAVRVADRGDDVSLNVAPE
jgi:hypothetical protein